MYTLQDSSFVTPKKETKGRRLRAGVLHQSHWALDGCTRMASFLMFWGCLSVFITLPLPGKKAVNSGMRTLAKGCWVPSLFGYGGPSPHLNNLAFFHPSYLLPCSCHRKQCNGGFASGLQLPSNLSKRCEKRRCSFLFRMLGFSPVCT